MTEGMPEVAVLTPAAWLRATIEADLALGRRLAARWVAPPDHEDAGAPIWPSPSTRALPVFRSRDPDACAGLDLITLCSPAYLVARCEAELGILDLHAPEWHEEDVDGYDYRARQVCTRCDDGYWPCRTIRLLASGYRHRPGYDAGDWEA